MSPIVPDPATSPGDLADLRAFCLVVDLGSVTAAAKALGETKGSVSRRLSRLEQALGVALLVRSARSVQPTQDGLTYRARVGEALELFDDATAAVQQAQGVPSGLLRVTATQDLGVGMLAPLVTRFRERFPAVEVEMLLTERLLDFEADQLDVAIRMVQGGIRDTSLVATRLALTDELRAGFYAAPAYLAKAGVPTTPEALTHRPLLLCFGGRAQLQLTLARRDNPRQTTSLRVRGSVVSSDASFAREVAVSGGGIVLMMAALADREIAERRLVEVLVDWRVVAQGGAYLLHRAGRFLTPKVRTFRDFVLEADAAGCPRTAT